MPKAIILFSFTKADKTTLIDNLKDLEFKRKDGRRIIFSKEFSLSAGRPNDEHAFSRRSS